MQISPNGIKFIQGFEQCRLKAYQDSGGVWTVGWGTTGANIGANTVWTQDQCDDAFEMDMQKFSDGVTILLGMCSVNQNQFDALVSFDYNTGALGQSHLLIYTRAGQFAQAAAEFPKWDHVHSIELPGLKRRRLAEQILFES